MNATTAEQPPSLKAPEFYPTFFLCLFLGVFGAHRFYTGRIKSGIAQLVTFGGCGLWALVDTVIVLLGKFRDKNGVPIPNVNPKLTWPIFGLACLLGVIGGIADSGKTASDTASTKSGRTVTVSGGPDIIGTWVGDYADERGQDIMKISEQNNIVESYYSREPNASVVGGWRFDPKTGELSINWSFGDETFTVKDGVMVNDKGTQTFRKESTHSDATSRPVKVAGGVSDKARDERTIKLSVKCEHTESSYQVGMAICKLVWKTAKKNTKAGLIEVTVQLDDELTDKYGKTVPGPHIMGTILVDDLDEIRKYVSADAYNVDLNRQYYGMKVQGMDYGWMLRKD